MTALIRQCRSCTRTAKGAIGLARSVLGVGLASPRQIEQRLAICRACPEAVPCVHNTRQVCKCDICHCWLRHKTRLKRERCPLGQW